ncbi:hypothetical protein A8B79_14200 [Balneola sp. EhC07]|uniref:SIR2 family protein n=1 Tax=Balneola sp. EhC07 TaxID=1849360 RepID=UPI0007F44EF6|nr:SIR2 family protein [Balneola sp. EhC07]OAN64141.1 hypothetical protein A8B79_14200 [Balneola sp. EhC07]
MSEQTKTVFVLGAGASHDVGAPLVNNFLDEAWKLWKTGNIQPDQEKSFKRVFSALGELQRVHSKSKLNLNNLESVFSIFEMSSYLGHYFNEPDEGNRTTHASEFVKALKELIIVTLERSIKLPIANGNITPMGSYVDFVKLVNRLRRKGQPNHDVKIISFNYDLMLDLSFEKAGIGVDYGLKAYSSSRNPIPIYKLHGSLNWGVEEESNQIIPWDFASYFSNRSYGYHTDGGYLTLGSHILDGEFKKENEKIGKEVFLVPPTFNKTFNNKEIREVWRKASKALSEAENLFIIGFSLPETDLFFKYLYALGTAGIDLFQRLWVFDPKPEGKEVDVKYKKLLGPGAELRYKYHPNRFDEAIKILKEEFRV